MNQLFEGSMSVANVEYFSKGLQELHLKPDQPFKVRGICRFSETTIESNMFVKEQHFGSRQ